MQMVKRTPPFKIWPGNVILLCTLFLFLMAKESNAVLSQEEIKSERDTLQNSIRHSDIGSGYAHILNFFIEPNISASTYNVDDETNTRLEIYKFPLQKNFSLNSDGWEIGLRGNLSYATLKMDYSVIDDEIIESTWKAYSGSIGTGLFIPVIDNFTLMSAADIGLSHLRNSSKYNGWTANDFARILDGLLYNWDTEVWIGSLVFGLDYNYLFTKEYTLDLKGRYTYSYVSSFDESGDFPSFNGYAQTLSLEADFIHPLGFSIAKNPFFGVVHLGNTTFLGNNRNTLGFNSFAEAGYSLQVDITHLDFFLQNLRIGYQLSVGHNLEGHTFLFGADLAVF